MRFLLHGTLSSSAAAAVLRHGHLVRHIAELGLSASADASKVLETARVQQLDVMTDDAALVDVPFATGSRFSRCIVYLQLGGGDVEQDDAIDRLFARYKRLACRRVYTVTGTRVKVRQLPGARTGREG